MLTKRAARQIRDGITRGRSQARFEQQYALGGAARFLHPGSLFACDGAPDNLPGLLAYWRTLGRSPNTPSNY